MEAAYSVFRDLALIVIFAKFFGLIARRCKMPQVVGEILAGLLIGPCVLNWVQLTDYISKTAEIGVVLLMFGTGLGTNLQDLKKAGAKAFAIACSGVFIPLVGGTLLYSCFYGFSAVGSEHFYKALFIGTIMTATSVSITVATLQELGKISTFVGTTIVSAAIIDDVIGILVLTCVVSAGTSTGNIGGVFAKTGLFIVFSAIVAFVGYKIMKWFDNRYPHTQRVPIVSLAFCFAMAYIAEAHFGIADITGAYIAGVILCSIQDAGYVSRKIDISSYMLFGPVFFASVGLKTDISGLTPEILIFSLCFVAVALITKIVGCGGVSALLGFRGRDRLRIGVGMMTRGEVALIVAQKGLSVGLIESIYFAPVILLILISSVATPICLKILFKDK
ncbi:Kef-type K+ transport system, membrane component KefB [Lachnospiraceae bacterium G11]|nr:Kef-type K+ transport system, membrane component KefB [Lachnospiraceae bacterium G11]